MYLWKCLINVLIRGEKPKNQIKGKPVDVTMRQSKLRKFTSVGTRVILLADEINNESSRMRTQPAGFQIKLCSECFTSRSTTDVSNNIFHMSHVFVICRENRDSEKTSFSVDTGCLLWKVRRNRNWHALTENQFVLPF